MKRPILGFMCLLLSSITVQANGASPPEKWHVAQIAIEKNTDGKIEKTVYGKDIKAKSDDIPRLQKWITTFQKRNYKFLQL